jgi:hypothetical protein
MSLIAREKGFSSVSGASGTPSSGNFKVASAGTHLAVCNMVVDLGEQETTFRGQTSRKRKIYLRWELPHERMEYIKKDGTAVDAPVCVGKQYTASLHPKSTLRADLETWRGRAFTEQELAGFDLTVLAGQPCQLVLVHAQAASGRTYAQVRGVSGWPRGMPRPERTENPIVTHSEGDAASYARLPEFVRKMIDGRGDYERA